MVPYLIFTQTHLANCLVRLSAAEKTEQSRRGGEEKCKVPGRLAIRQGAAQMTRSPNLQEKRKMEARCEPEVDKKFASTCYVITSHNDSKSTV